IGGEFRFIADDIENFVQSQRVTRSSSDPFEKFTDSAREILSGADEEAHQYGHHYIGTEHFLLGIIRADEGVAAEALRRSGLTLQDVRQGVVDIFEKGNQKVAENPAAQLKMAMRGAIGTGHTPSSTGARSLTRRAKKVIELAVEEATLMKHDSLA